MNRDHVEALTRRASILIDQNRYEDAAAMLAEALGNDPENASALYMLALCQMNIPSKVSEAIETINRAISIDSMNSSFFALRSLVYNKLDKNKQALEDANLAISADPEDVFAHIAHGSALLGLEKWREAEMAFRAALAIDPDNTDAGNLLTVSLRHQNKMDKTTGQVEHFLAKNPNDSFSHANAGWVALERHDLKKAKFHFLESLRIDPHSEYARSGIIETFKAKSPLYRLYLDYCLKMAKLPTQARFGIIIGLYFAVKLMRAIFTGNLMVIGSIAVLLYMLFAMWTWVARGVGNLFLLLNRFARNALKKGEKIEAVLVGGNVLAGIFITIIAFGAGIKSLVFLGPSLIGSALPFSLVFQNNHRIGKHFYTIIGGLVLFGGVLSFLLYFIPIQNLYPVTAGGCAILLAVIVSWLGAFGFLRK
jgi:tetratricopeptide (TPR) repeat protein